MQFESNAQPDQKWGSFSSLASKHTVILVDLTFFLALVLLFQSICIILTTPTQIAYDTILHDELFFNC